MGTQGCISLFGESSQHMNVLNVFIVGRIIQAKLEATQIKIWYMDIFTAFFKGFYKGLTTLVT